MVTYKVSNCSKKPELLSQFITRAMEDCGNFRALEFEILRSTDIKVDRRKLSDIAYGLNVTLRITEIQALIFYFEQKGTPIISILRTDMLSLLRVNTLSEIEKKIELIERANNAISTYVTCLRQTVSAIQK